MAINIHPVAPVAMRRVSTSVALLNAGRDGSGVITALVTAGTNGSVVTSIKVRSQVAAGASAAQVVRLWHQNNGTGTWYMIDEVALATATSSSTVVGASATFNLTNIVLAGQTAGSASTADKLGFTITVSESVAISAEVGDY